MAFVGRRSLRFMCFGLAFTRFTRLNAAQCNRPSPILSTSETLRHARRGDGLTGVDAFGDFEVDAWNEDEYRPLAHAEAAQGK
jgi:hypothetical protein